MISKIFFRALKTACKKDNSESEIYLEELRKIALRDWCMGRTDPHGRLDSNFTVDDRNWRLGN